MKSQKIHYINCLIIVTFISLLFSCGRKDPDSTKAPEPVPCQTGLNSFSCDKELKDHSAWEQEIIVPGKTTSVPNTVFKVIFQFWFGEDGPTIKRTIISDKSENSKVISMSETGEIINIDDQSIKVMFKNSTCKNKNVDIFLRQSSSNTETVLYFKRYEDSLFITPNKIEKTESSYKNPIDAIFGGMLNAIGRGFQEVIQNMIQQILTFNSLRSILVNSSFQLKQREWPEPEETESTEGCFTWFGKGFY